jgi:hypothetical protein
MQGQMYSAVGSASALDSVGDLMSIEPVTENPCLIHRVEIGQIDLEADAEAAMAHVKFSLFATAGTTGTTPTPSPLLPGGEAADAGARFLAAGDASSTETILYQGAWNVQAGLLWLPTPEERPWCHATGVFVVKNMEIQAAAITQVTIVFEEFKMV